MLSDTRAGFFYIDNNSSIFISINICHCISFHSCRKELKPNAFACWRAITCRYSKSSYSSKLITVAFRVKEFRLLRIPCLDGITFALMNLRIWKDTPPMRAQWKRNGTKKKIECDGTFSLVQGLLFQSICHFQDFFWTDDQIRNIYYDNPVFHVPKQQWSTVCTSTSCSAPIVPHTHCVPKHKVWILFMQAHGVRVGRFVCGHEALGLDINWMCLLKMYLYS